MNEKELFENYKKEVYKTCYFMLHNDADAEDVCQEVFISVFHYDWKRVEHLKTWMMRIAINHCLNHLKKTSRYKAKEIKLQLQPLRSIEKATEVAAEERESTEACMLLLSQLPMKMRAVISLRFMNEYSLNEIAEILSIPLGTVKSRLNKGLKQMKFIVDADEINQGKDDGIYGQGGANIYSVSK
jgi:RNA polymerase sigma factor (sigma-70 family)